jgi:hypothetical protein
MMNYDFLTAEAGSNGKKPSDQGLVQVFVLLSLACLFGIAALVVDLGHGYYQQRTIQNAADAASFAAVNLLSSTITDTEIVQESQELAGANGMDLSEILDIECGNWDRDARTFSACADPCTGLCLCESCSDAQANAVRVFANRHVSTSFGRLLGVSHLFPVVESIAHRRMDPDAMCLRPFGIETSYLDDEDDPIEIGDTFVIKTPSPGNWGKLDVGGINMSDGTNFRKYMLEGICDVIVNVGDQIGPGTGFGGTIETAFVPVLGEELIFLGVSDFGEGNSDTVAVNDFLKVRFDAQKKMGANWEATFTLLARPAQIPDPNDPDTMMRVMVK